MMAAVGFGFAARDTAPWDGFLWHSDPFDSDGVYVNASSRLHKLGQRARTSETYLVLFKIGYFVAANYGLGAQFRSI